MNILLVDDHALFRGGLKFLLQQLDTGLVLDEAGNCAQALERAEVRRYDLVLLDLNMPGVSQLDALAALREAVPDAPVVVLSGEADPRVVRAAIEGGAMGFIPKSSTPEVMVQALRKECRIRCWLLPLLGKIEAISKMSRAPAERATKLCARYDRPAIFEMASS